MKGGRLLLLFIFGFLGFISYGEATVRSWSSHRCQGAGAFKYGFFMLIRVERYCKAAIYYSCLTNGNKHVYTGYGCYDTFVKDCKEVNHDARVFFKKKDFKDGLVFNEGNVFAYICYTETNCAQKKFETPFFKDSGFDKYEERIKKNGDQTVKDEKCESPPGKDTGDEDMTAYDDPSDGGSVDGKAGENNATRGGNNGTNGESSGGGGNKLDNAFGLLGMMAIFVGWNFIQIW